MNNKKELLSDPIFINLVQNFCYLNHYLKQNRIYNDTQHLLKTQKEFTLQTLLYYVNEETYFHEKNTHQKLNVLFKIQDVEQEKFLSNDQVEIFELFLNYLTDVYSSVGITDILLSQLLDHILILKE